MIFKISFIIFRLIYFIIPLKLLHIFCIEEKLGIKRYFFLNLYNFCFHKNFITFNYSIFLQVSGIGMGANFWSTAANLFIFYCEFNYVSYTNNSYKVCRYVDDLIIFEDKLQKSIDEIYPNYLKLIEAPDINLQVDFLDFDL